MFPSEYFCMFYSTFQRPLFLSCFLIWLQKVLFKSCFNSLFTYFRIRFQLSLVKGHINNLPTKDPSLTSRDAQIVITWVGTYCCNLQCATAARDLEVISRLGHLIKLRADNWQGSSQHPANITSYLQCPDLQKGLLFTPTLEYVYGPT